jgi:regulator of sigma E protease
VGDTKINFATDDTFTSLLSSYDVGEDITLQIERDGERQNVVVQLYEITEEETTKNVLGVTVKSYPFPFFQAIIRSIPFTLAWAWKVLAILFMLITGQMSFSGVGGPITTITTIATYTQASFAGFLVLLPIIAVNLAVFNLVPFPALDGARMVFTGIEWIRKKPINPKIEGTIHFVGLMILLILVFVADFFQLIS